jgi:hypothetical protein
MRNVTAPASDVVINLPVGGRITGRVFDKATHHPIASFQAGINPSRSVGGRMFSMPPLLRSFTSDDGSFILENVPPGNTQVVVNAPGYAAGRVASLNVEDGKTLTDVEVGLETGTRLSGRITATDGTPISGATVREGDGSPMMRMMQDGATTDPNGDYTIESLEPGEKTFQIAAQGYLNESRTVTLSDRETRLDVQLSSGTKVTGSVVTESGTPVADAEVRAMGTAGTFGGRTARTDTSGSFQFEGFAPGHYTFVALRSPYAQASVRDVDVSSGAPIRIVMKSGATIYGHVTGLSATELTNAQVFAGSAAAGVDASGNFRIEGVQSGTVQVRADTMRSMSGNARSAPRKSVEVAPGASVQVDVVFPNDTTVRGRVTRNGRPLTGAFVDFVPRNGVAQTQARGQTDEGGSYSVTGVEMERFTPFSTTYEVHGSGSFDIDIKAAPLRGRVTDAATGEAIADARVDLRAAAGTDTMGMRSGTTDASGNFLIDFVPPGSYQATASKGGYGNQLLDVAVTESGGPALDFKLSTNAGITLKVVDGRDGRLLSADVRAVDGQGRVVFESNRFFGGGDPSTQKLPLAAGQYGVTVSARGYASQTLSLVSPSQRTVTLLPGSSLTIRSQSSTRRRARLLNANGEPYGRFAYGDPIFALEAAPGGASLPNIAPGVYTLQVLDANDQVTASVKVTITEGVEATVDL